MHSRLTCVFFAVVVFSRLGNAENDYASNYRSYNSRPYRYSYAVSSPETGDHKSQWETRENGVVRGSYSLLQPDGTTRVVDYTADHTGFHPTVRVLGNSANHHDFHQPDPTYKPQYYDRRFYSTPDDYNHPNRFYYYGRGKPVQPLLSSAYHGYDNLYH